MRAGLIRALLVDDEMLARLALRQALGPHPDVIVVGECGNADEARAAFESIRPNLIFLDIRMPGTDCFEFLSGLDAETAPLVVFTTALRQHALRALNANALDYLLKPIEQSRFDQTMRRVRTHWRGLRIVGSDSGLRNTPAEGQEWLQRLSVRVGEHISVIATRDIDCIESHGNYTQIHMGGATHLYRETLTNLLAVLDPARFLRIHRRIIVNLERVRHVHPLFNGNAELVLQNGARVTLSRRFRGPARRALGLP